MGSINQFIKFIPNLASLSAPFRELMQKNKPFNWSTVHAEAFEKIKKEICNTVTNHHFDVNLNTRVKCDASHLGLGVSIEQDHWRTWKTVAFARRFLKIDELKYSTIELELLSLVCALDNFKNYMLGKQFSILTGHKVLIAALKDDKLINTRKGLNLVSPFGRTNYHQSTLPSSICRVRIWDFLTIYFDTHRVNPYQFRSTTRNSLSLR